MVTCMIMITSIGDFAFLNDSYNMTSIHLPEGIRRIGKYAFAGNYGLTSISIPASVELIDTAAFYYCTELTAVQVNSNNRHYCSENGVLFNKDKSTLIIYPAKKQDSYYALPSNVKVIETAAFMSCQALTEIILPEGLETINGEAFEYCTNLAKINIPNSVNYIGSWAFDETAIYENENNWTDGALYIDNCLIATDYDFPNNNYDILSGTRLIAGGVFDYSGILEEVTIPASVVSIGEYAFRHCNALKKITILAKNPPMLGRNVFEDVSRSIPVYVPAEALEDYQTAKTWNEFNLQAIPPTALQTPSMPESIRVYGGLLHNPQGLPVSIYDMQGRRVYSGTAATVSQPAGMYVLRCGGASRKVLF